MKTLKTIVLSLLLCFIFLFIVAPKKVSAVVCAGNVSCFASACQLWSAEYCTCSDPIDCQQNNGCWKRDCLEWGCSGSTVSNGTCSTATNCGPVCNNNCNIYENRCEIASDPGGPTPPPGPGPGGGGGCGAQCNTVADCSIGGAQNPACSGGVCWDAQACGGGGGGNNCDFQFTCPDGRVCPPGDACALNSEGTYSCRFRTECAVCGDGRCTDTNDKETCNNCAVDCGLCPGTLRGRAMVVNRADTSCTAVLASNTGLDNTQIRFTRGNNSFSDRQNGRSYVAFTRQGGTYTIRATPHDNYYDYTVVRACWRSTMGIPSGEGLTQQLSPDEVLTWDIGVIQPGAWYQVTGGDAYADQTLRSYVASRANPRVFIDEGDGRFPGVAQYGILHDFDSSFDSQGETLVSTRNWLVHEDHAHIDLYDTFYNKLGAPTTPDSFANLAALPLPASRATPYYITGDVTTSGNWSVGSGQSVVLIIDGNLTFNGRVNVSGTGFIAFIVSGNITIVPSIGHPAGSSQYDLEGVYITSGTFQTGTSGAATEQLTVRGSVVAESVLLQRDLESVGRNAYDPAEKFIYNPELLLRMPEAMKDTPVFWQEVGP